MPSLTLRSPAKLNLFLKVINKRPDGYHNLQTLFERIDLCDQIRLTSNRNGTIRIVCDHPQVPQGPKNLCYQAAQILQKACKVSQGVTITITKRIPVAAGLAGGSSNAATVLWGLNRLWGLSLDQRRLLHWGGIVGSDVCFFLHDCSFGLGTSRGEVIQPVKITPKFWHILVVPRIKMYSREVFTRLNLQLTKNGDDVNILIRCLKNNSIKEAQHLLFNDLETSILQIAPRLLAVQKRIRASHDADVIFSGSGPSVFSLTATRLAAEKIKALLGRQYTQVYVVKTL